MKSRLFILSVLAVLGVPALGFGSVATSLVPVTISGEPSNLQTFDLKVTVTGGANWTNQRLDLSLTQGTICQDTAFGGDSQPNPLLFSVDAALQWDTFFTGPRGWPNTSATGAAPSFVQDNESSTVLGVSWGDLSDNTGNGTFTVARITLSSGAVGSYSGNGFDTASGGVGTAFSGNIGTAVPEPASLTMLGLGVVALLARRRKTA